MMNKIIGIDILRGFSAVLIVLYHYTWRYNEVDATLDYHQSWNLTFSWGCMAVVTFFMISGYLTNRSLESQISPKSFIKKRFWRLYPTFWVSLFISYIIMNASGMFDISIRDLLINLTMMPALFGVEAVDGVYWTQQYELVFYAYIIALLLIKNVKCTDGVLLGWIIISILGFFFQIDNDAIWAKFFRVFMIPEYVSAFIAGMIIGRGYSLARLIIILLSVINIFIWHGTILLFYFLLSLVAIWYIAYHPYSVINKGNKLFRPILFVASISYPLYLLHQHIGYVIISYIIKTTGIQNEFILIIPIVFVLVLAYMLNRFVEIPSAKFSSRIVSLKER